MMKYSRVAGQLQDRLALLLRRVGKIETDLRSVHDRDWVERANELENDEVLEGLDQMSVKEVRDIRQALKRIESGQYDMCFSCGRPIGAARLAAAPTAMTCLICATHGLAESDTPLL